MVSKFFSAFLARIRKRFFSKQPNFPLESWFTEYVLIELNKYNESNNQCKFRISELIGELKNSDVQKTERFWIKYTLPIQIEYLKELYL